MLASRNRAKLGTRFDPTDELRIGPVMNRALEWVLGAEVVMINLGASFPAGGSRLMARSSHRSGPPTGGKKNRALFGPGACRSDCY